MVLDPFSGSATTSIASNVLGRRCIGIEQETEYLQLSQVLYEDLQNDGRKGFFKQHFYRLLNKESKS